MTAATAAPATPDEADPTPADGRHGAGAEAGFTLVETMVSVFIISVVMAALTNFFVTAVLTTDHQGAVQTATRVATEASSRVRTMKGSALTAGRDAMTSHTQWNNPAPGVAPYRVDMAEAWDATATVGAGGSAGTALPTTPQTTTVDGIAFLKHWYIGRCWQPLGGGACTATQISGGATFFRVVVAVTWQGRTCAQRTCFFVTSTLVSNAPKDPLFDLDGGGADALVINHPGNQAGAVGSAVGLQLTASGGTAPLGWSVIGLPGGVGSSAGGLLSGTLTGPAAVVTVTVNVSDAGGQTATITFTWTVTVSTPANASGLTYSRPCTVVSPTMPAYRAVSTAAGAAGTTFVDVPLPTTTQPGDVLVAFVLSTKATSAVTPTGTGWNAATLREGATAVGPQVTSAASNSAGVYWRIADPTSGTYRFGWPDSTGSGTVLLAAYTGVDPVNPLGTVMVTEQPTGAGVTGGALTMNTSPSRYALAAMMTSTLPATANGPMTSTDTELTSRGAVSATNTAGRVSLWDKVYTMNGSTGSPPVTWGAPNKPGVSFAMLLQPRTSSYIDPTVVLDWTPSVDTSVTGYQVARGATTTSVAGRTTATWTDYTTAAASGYTYTLTSVNAGGSSSGVGVTVPACSTVIPPVVRAVTTSNGPSDLYADVAKPTSQAGDLLLAFAMSTDEDDPMLPVPSLGWTQAGPRISSDGDNMGAVFWRIATGLEPATYRFSWNDDDDRGVVILAAYSGVDPLNPVVGIQNTIGSGTSVIAKAQNPTRAPSRLVVAAGANATTAKSTPTGMTNRATITATDGKGALSMWDETRNLAGNTGTRTTSWAGSEPYLAFSVIVQGPPV